MTEFLRRPQHRYEDPLARVWILCAQRLGFRIERTSELYASTDGRGTILIGTPDTLDPDDSLAQMIFHELCHALVEGEEGERLPDWGLDNISNKHRWREHACLRLQAYLAGGVGLRDFFAPTTDFRVSFWATLPADPFFAAPEAGGRREPSCVAGRLGAWRASQPRWAPHLREVLSATAAIASVMTRAAASTTSAVTGTGSSALVSDDRSDPEVMPSLWTTVHEAPSAHPAGHAAIADYHRAHGCSDCAWAFIERGRQRCRHAPRIRLNADAPACDRWEPSDELNCASCGACCREAYHTVEVGLREPVMRRHPALVLARDQRGKLRRDGERCVALTGGHTPTDPYACSIYPDRPRTCREFTQGSANCLDARRRVGFSL